MTTTELSPDVRDDGLCAVVDCLEQARPQVCPFDGRYHWHGCIHYAGEDRTGLAYRPGAWRRICDTHYDVVRTLYPRAS